MYLADTLSRAALNLLTPSEPQKEVFQCNSEDALEMFRVELESMELDSRDMYPSTLEEIKAETKADPTLSVLCMFVAHGWPSDKSRSNVLAWNASCNPSRECQMFIVC